MALKDQNWLRRHQHALVYLGGGGGGALSNTFFVSLFSYFTVIFKFPDIIYNISNIISYNTLIKFLEFNYLDYWILLSISLLHLTIFLKYKDYINEEINYCDDINLNKIIYHIVFVAVLYIIGIITKFNILIFWAINHIIIELLLLLYLYVNYIYALYILKTYNIPSIVIGAYSSKTLMETPRIFARYIEERELVTCEHLINNSYIISYNYKQGEYCLLNFSSNKNLDIIASNNDFINEMVGRNLDILSLSILEFIISNKEKISVISIIIGIIKLLFI